MNTIRTNPPASSKGLGKASLLAAALLTALFCGVACGSEEGTTPECVQDVYFDAGADVLVHENVENGCNPYPHCTINGEWANPNECCKGLGNTMSFEYQTCMAGYGVSVTP